MTETDEFIARDEATRKLFCDVVGVGESSTWQDVYEAMKEQLGVDRHAATGEWLESVGFVHVTTWPERWEITVGLSEDGETFDGRISIGVDGWASLKPCGFPQGVSAVAATRGEVRRLCKAFGVTLQGSATDADSSR